MRPDVRTTLQWTDDLGDSWQTVGSLEPGAGSWAGTAGFDISVKEEGEVRLAGSLADRGLFRVRTEMVP
ncbi:MAG: hypothetical protein AAF514_07900 [Verrucomicrobiota bacterium]